MKKINFLMLLAALGLMTACQGNKIQTQRERDSEQLSVSSSSEKLNSKEPVFNGSYYTVEGKHGEILLVNKKYPLSDTYNPGEDPTAKAAFLDLLAAMQAQGFAVSSQYSGFRSYETQAILYQNYVDRDGQIAADRYSARPGHSEHQTGLAFDILDTDGNLLTEPMASNWLLENAPQYGFIVRYIEGKEETTGYMAESWHVRYIGSEAVDIAATRLTLEEYLGVDGGDYAE